MIPAALAHMCAHAARGQPRCLRPASCAYRPTSPSRWRAAAYAAPMARQNSSTCMQPCHSSFGPCARLFSPRRIRHAHTCAAAGRAGSGARGAGLRSTRGGPGGRAPPDTSLKLRLSMPSASADAFFSTCSWYALNSGPAACFSATARPVIVWLCGPPCAVAHHHVIAHSTVRRRSLVHQQARPSSPAPAPFLSNVCLCCSPRSLNPHTQVQPQGPTHKKRSLGYPDNPVSISRKKRPKKTFKSDPDHDAARNPQHS
jgi:hypothetical protein